MNKDYWDNFYSTNKIINKESSFANYVLQYIISNNIKGKLIDVACGNGRDAKYFNINNIDVVGIDQSIQLDDTSFEFIKGDLFKHDYSKYRMIYFRFVIHTLTEFEFNAILDILKRLNNVYIFIETRSTKNITDEEKSETFFKSSIGEEHFRMLYSKKYLDDKLSDFNIIESSEGRYSKYGTDDPYCIRYILGDNYEK